MEQQFKVGSVYRSVGGFVLKLEYAVSVPKWERERPGHSFAQSVAVLPCRKFAIGEAAGYMSLVDGQYCASAEPSNAWHLIPGELTLVDGEWVGFDFKREDEPAGSRPPYGHKPTTLGDLLRGAKAILDKLPAVAPPATDQNAAMVARDGPARPAWQPAPQPAPEPVNKPQGPHAAFFALRVDVPAGHLLGQGNPDF